MTLSFIFRPYSIFLPLIFIGFFFYIYFLYFFIYFFIYIFFITSFSYVDIDVIYCMVFVLNTLFCCFWDE